MSDHLTNPDRGELDLQSAIPPEPSPAALDRMRGGVHLRTTPARIRNTRVRVLRGTGVALAAAFAVWFLAASPAIENRAFARDQAADALVFARDGRVTHVVARFTETSWNEQFGHDERLDIDQRTEEWYDPANQRSYARTINVADGSVDGVAVRVDDQEMRFQNNVRYMTGDQPQLLSGSTALPFASSVGSITDQVRAEIADGHARVEGIRIVDGQECWLVVIDVNELVRKHGYDETPDPRSSDIMTVTLRKDDYLMTTWARESIMFNGNGKSTGSMRLQIELLEHVERGNVDESIFSLDAVRRMAPEGTKVTKTVDGAAVE